MCATRNASSLPSLTQSNGGKVMVYGAFKPFAMRTEEFTSICTPLPHLEKMEEVSIRMLFTNEILYSVGSGFSAKKQNEVLNG